MKERSGIASRVFSAIPVIAFRADSPTSSLFSHFGSADLEIFLYLVAQALVRNSFGMLLEYAHWLKTLFHSRGIDPAVVDRVRKTIESLLHSSFGPGERDAIVKTLDRFFDEFRSSNASPRSFLDDAGEFRPAASAYLDHLLSWNTDAATEQVLSLASSGVPIRKIYLRVLEPVQRELGLLWQTNRITVAEEHYCTAVTNAVMTRLQPYRTPVKKHGGMFLAATVESELHEVGLRMVTDFFELDGWRTVFIGARAPADDLVRIILDRQPDILGLSMSMMYHADELLRLIRSIRETGRQNRILVGGLPFLTDASLREYVGADATAPDAEAAVEWAGRMFREAGNQ